MSSFGFVEDDDDEDEEGEFENASLDAEDADDVDDDFEQFLTTSSVFALSILLNGLKIIYILFLSFHYI